MEDDPGSAAVKSGRRAFEEVDVVPDVVQQERGGETTE
jgi:hypothetical protein